MVGSEGEAVYVLRQVDAERVVVDASPNAYDESCSPVAELGRLNATFTMAASAGDRHGMKRASSRRGPRRCCYRVPSRLTWPNRAFQISKGGPLPARSHCHVRVA
jgi:hypothetical protein